MSSMPSLTIDQVSLEARILELVPTNKQRNRVRGWFAKEQYGRALGYLARHGKNPCLPLSRLLECGITREALDFVISNDDKGRFFIGDVDGEECFMACQGHSNDGLPQDFYEEVAAPEVLFHKTTEEAAAIIRHEGLKSMGRLVHMTDNPAHLRVGDKYSVLITIRYPPGSMIMQSKNGVYLAEAVPPEYLAFSV